MEKSFDLTDADISLLENWNNITYTIFIFPFIFLVHHRGLRMPMVYTAALMVMGAFARCLLYWDVGTSKVMMNVGNFLIGIAGPVAYFCCTCISAAWFPPSQRTLATAIMSVAQSGGVAFSFVIGPQFVHYLSRDAPDDPETVRLAIQKLLYAEFILCAITLVFVLIYFPSKPPTPPCESAATARLPLWQSIKEMCSSVNALMIFFVYSVSTGIFSGWYSLLNIAVSDVMGESESGWLGFWMTVIGIGTAIIAGFVGDRFPRYMKLMVAVLITISAAFFSWFTLTANQEFGIKYDRVSTWVAAIVGGSMAAATQPLCFELGNEVVFPTPEASVTGFLTGLNNVITMVYLFVQLIPGIGNHWLNWSQAIAMWICLPVLFFFKPTFKRLDMDEAAFNNDAFNVNNNDGNNNNNGDNSSQAVAA